jgi:Ca2+-transporting ATPase
MDTAITELFKKFEQTDRTESVLIKEYPLSKKLFTITRVFKLGETYIASCKGAPEAILDLCKTEDSERTKYLEVLEELAEQGQRILGVAYAKLDSPMLPTTQNEFDFNFIGLIGFEDPIRPEVPTAIEECYNAGIRTIMITGDYSATALSIAKQAGIKTYGKVLTGKDLVHMDDTTLIEKIRTTNVFARIIPDQKLRIIQALKKNGEIVAMTGDGVNDAPALKAADIGISMGLKGTDVAREASSMVLLDDNFASIVGAIKSGRRIFDNLRKAMSYIIAIHIPIIGLTLVPALLPSFPILLMPLHIVFMELIIDPICSIAFELESEEIGIMNRPPRNPKERFFGFRKILASASMGILLTIMVLAVYFLSIQEHHTDGEIRAITFSTLIVGNIFLIITTLSKTRNFISILKEKNVALLVIISLALTALSLVMLVPGFRKVFSFEFPGIEHFYISILASSIMLFALEFVKFFVKRRLIKN